MEEEDIHTNPTPSPGPKKNWYKSTGLIVTFLLIIVIGGYIVFDHLGGSLASENIFTQYKPLLPDTLLQKSDTLLLRTDSLGIDEDTAAVLSKQDAHSDTIWQPEISSNPDSTISSLFKVNTNYEKLQKVDTIHQQVQQGKSSTAVAGLFEELLLPKQLSQDSQLAFNNYSQENIVSSISIIKLLSIVGKYCLLGENTLDHEALFEAITASENVVGILIVDRLGKVAYATDRKFANASITVIMPKIDIDLTTLSWYQEANRDIVSLPLFHTYGKIGVAVLITEHKSI